MALSHAHPTSPQSSEVSMQHLMQEFAYWLSHLAHLLLDWPLLLPLPPPLLLLAFSFSLLEQPRLFSFSLLVRSFPFLFVQPIPLLLFRIIDRTLMKSLTLTIVCLQIPREGLSISKKESISQFVSSKSSFQVLDHGCDKS
eukprot:TRINITY_DN1685_c0_g1_i8.p1 TRINITY_DN1685_c0_g1~~TRINITY_DN1685_c0_g1_i8.p1  ORF type:complete len:141 (-),score=24.68 TRINITY_DN1685_c0_g1_i8:110-532(-)